ncbi:MAG: DUF1294 domain-containing protein, partial [Gammaproteobacteria bacterium]|nr:DUF1294 domain-containing protein [Gammaproteobacteria bacterium]
SCLALYQFFTLLIYLVIKLAACCNEYSYTFGKKVQLDGIAFILFFGRIPLLTSQCIIEQAKKGERSWIFKKLSIKGAARNDQWRTPESTLHLFALVGGWPGALAAQRLLRHKSKKQPFQMMFWTTVVLNCSTLAWLYSSSGSVALRSILGAA